MKKLFERLRDFLFPLTAEAMQKRMLRTLPKTRLGVRLILARRGMPIRPRWRPIGNIAYGAFWDALDWEDSIEWRDRT